jgi:hypothetical protein
MKALKEYITEVNTSNFDAAKVIKKNCPIKKLKKANKVFDPGDFNDEALTLSIPVKKSAYHRENEVDAIINAIEYNDTIYYSVAFWLHGEVPYFMMTSLENIEELASWITNRYKMQKSSTIGPDGELKDTTSRVEKPMPKKVQKDVVQDKQEIMRLDNAFYKVYGEKYR